MHADDVGMCPDMDDAILELAHRELVTTCAGIGGARAINVPAGELLPRIC
jgi:hypothetical protein